MLELFSSPLPFMYMWQKHIYTHTRVKNTAATEVEILALIVL